MTTTTAFATRVTKSPPPEGRELGAAISDAPSKIRAVDVCSLLASKRAPVGAQHQLFIDDFDSMHLMTRRPATFTEAIADGVDAVADAVHLLASNGVVATRRGAKALGAALDWRRKTFQERKEAMQDAVLGALVDRGAAVDSGPGQALVTIGGASVLCTVNAAPEGLSIATARELVGQPHRNDHRLADRLGDAIGPVHLLACPAGVTATQLRNLIGATDIITAVTPVGIWAADPVSRCQVLALRDCIDDNSTRRQVESALDWLATTGEDARLVHRARRRSMIVRAIGADDD